MCEYNSDVSDLKTFKFLYSWHWISFKANLNILKFYFRSIADAQESSIIFRIKKSRHEKIFLNELSFDKRMQCKLKEHFDRQLMTRSNIKISNESGRIKNMIDEK